MQRIILLDTNFLMIPFQFKVDIFAEIDRLCNFDYKIAVLDRVVEELEAIRKKARGKNKSAAELALELLKKKGLKIIRTNSKKSVDDLIAEYAEKGAIIATQDSALRRNVKRKKAGVIFLRKKSFLVMQNVL